MQFPGCKAPSGADEEKHPVSSFQLQASRFLGDDGEGEPPVPIPNTAVKPLSVDGTCRATGRESRTLPGINYQATH
jgi:hypothetical protein